MVEAATRLSLQDRYIAAYKELEDNVLVCEKLQISPDEGLKLLTTRYVFTTLARNGSYLDSETIFMSLDPKEQAFINEYMVDFNGAKAALRAGYAEVSAAATSRALLTKSIIKFCIMCRQLELRDISQVTSQSVVNELSKIAFADIGDYVKFNNNLVELKDSDTVDTSVISEVQSTQYGVKIKLCNKQGALELLGKHMGMFRDKVEISGKDGGPIQVEATLNVLRSKFATIIDRAADKLSEDLNKAGAQVVEDPAKIPTDNNNDGDKHGS